MDELGDNFIEWIHECKEYCIKRIMNEEKCYPSEMSINKHKDGEVILINGNPVYKIEDPKFNEDTNGFTIKSYRL